VHARYVFMCVCSLSFVHMLHSVFHRSCLPPLFLFIQATEDVKTLRQEETITSAFTGTSVCVCVGESLCVYCVSVLSSYTSMHIILSHSVPIHTTQHTVHRCPGTAANWGYSTPAGNCGSNACCVESSSPVPVTCVANGACV
jgi:hypothetical protein